MIVDIVPTALSVPTNVELTERLGDSSLAGNCGDILTGLIVITSMSNIDGASGGVPARGDNEV